MRRESRRRLTLTTSFSAVFLMSALILVPVTVTINKLLDDERVLDIHISETVEPELLQPVPEPKPEQLAELPEEEEPPPPDTTVDEPDEPVNPQPAEQQAAEKNIDWHELLQSKSERSEYFAEPVKPSMSPHFDELRKVAATRYAEPAFEAERPIWENTEKDMMGRTILRAGDCYRVIADPSAVRQWEFQTFSQYITFCEHYEKAPVELPWVTEIVAKYAYLQERRELKDL